jgi:hypothetical protein
LSAGIDGDQVVAGLDEISGPTTAESSSSSPASSALTTTTAAGGATDRSFGRAQIHFTRRSAAALPSPAASRKTAARLHPLAERAQRGGIAPRAHRVHGVPSSIEGRRVAADRCSPSTGSRISAAIRT